MAKTWRDLIPVIKLDIVSVSKNISNNVAVFLFQLMSYALKQAHVK